VAVEEEAARSTRDDDQTLQVRARPVVEAMLAVMPAQQIAPSQIEREITETALMHDGNKKRSSRCNGSQTPASGSRSTTSAPATRALRT